MNSTYEKVKENFLSGRLKNCKDYFSSHNYYVELGYCNIILDNLEQAKENFKYALNYDRRSHWGLFLIQLIKGEIADRPTYFEIRNFLEIDLSILIMYGKSKYVEQIIKYSDFLSFYNMECYKFIGRAFWANNFIPAAMFFFKLAKDKLYNDPELHYLLAYIHYTKDNDINKCIKELKICLEILPNYNPAVKLLSEVSK